MKLEFLFCYYSCKRKRFKTAKMLFKLQISSPDRIIIIVFCILIWDLKTLNNINELPKCEMLMRFFKKILSQLYTESLIVTKVPSNNPSKIVWFFFFLIFNSNSWNYNLPLQYSQVHSWSLSLDPTLQVFKENSQEITHLFNLGV